MGLCWILVFDSHGVFFTKKKYPSSTPEEDVTHHTHSGLLQLFSCALVERSCWLIFTRWPHSCSALPSALNEQEKLAKYTRTPNTQVEKNNFRIHFCTSKAQLRYIIWFAKTSCFSQFYRWVSEASGGQDTRLRSHRANGWVGFGVPSIPPDHKPLHHEQHYMLMVSLVSGATGFLRKGKLFNRPGKPL